jgi:translation initiation factor 2B subunit (eIF-2B alpha/beta/delta family)
MNSREEEGKEERKSTVLEALSTRIDQMSQKNAKIEKIIKFLETNLEQQRRASASMFWLVRIMLLLALAALAISVLALGRSWNRE